VSHRIFVAEKDNFMAKRIHANGKASVQARYNITGGCDTDKNIIVAPFIMQKQVT